MFYIPQSNTEIPSIEAFRALHPHTSFGTLESEAERNAAGLFSVEDNRPIGYDRDFFTVVRGDIELVNGSYVRRYEVVPRNLSPLERLDIMAARLDRDLDNYYDSVAQSRRYKDRITCSVRAGKPGPFRAEGDAFFAWMEQCNATAYRLLEEVKAGTRPIPASLEEVLPELPQMVWPDPVTYSAEPAMV